MKRFTASLVLCILMSLVLSQVARSQTSVFEWVKILGVVDNPDKRDNGQCISFSMTLDNEGNMYTTGFFSDTLDFDPGASEYNLTTFGKLSQRNVFITKLDTNGDLIWAKSLNSTKWASGYEIAVDDFKNVYVAGYFEDTLDVNPRSGLHHLISKGVSDMFITKLDSNGDFIWARQIDIKKTDHLSKKIHLKIDNANQVYFVGNFIDTIDFNIGTPGFLVSHGSNDVFLSKLDLDGNFLWIKQFGGASEDWISSLALDNMGNMHIFGIFRGTVDFDPGVGVFEFTSQYYGIFISKLDAGGEFLWAKAVLSNLAYIGVADISLDSVGNIYTSGHFKRIVDFNPGEGIYNLYNEGFNYYPDAFITKLNSNGDFLWAKEFDAGWNMSIISSMDVDKNGNVYTMGWFFHDVDFDPNFYSEHIVNGELHGSMFICRLNANGSFGWVKHIAGLFSYHHEAGDGNDDAVIKADDFGNVYASGWFDGSGYFGVDEKDFFQVNVGGYLSKAFNLKISQENWIDNPELNLEEKVIIFPNPAHNFTHVSMNILAQGSISLVGIEGRILQEIKLQPGPHTYTLQFPNYAKGLYFLDIVVDGKRNKIEKLIIK